MDGLLLVTVTIVFICSVVSSSRMNVEENCVRMVQKSGKKSYITAEYSCYTHTAPCGPSCNPFCQCQRAHEEIQYVQRFVTYYFMEAECCDGYKEVMEGDQVKCEPYSEVFFQLLFTNGNLDECLNWKLIFDSHKVAESFSKGLRNTLSSICSCDVPSSNVADIQLLCINQLPLVHIYHGRIVATNDRNASQLAGDIRRVALERRSISILGEQFQALDNCTCCNIIEESELGSRNAAEMCIRETHGSETLNSGEKAGIAIATTVFALFSIIVAIAVGWKCKRRLRRDNYGQVGQNRGQEGPGR